MAINLHVMYQDIRFIPLQDGFRWGMFTAQRILVAEGVVPIFDTDDATEIGIAYRQLVAFDILLWMHPIGKVLMGYMNILTAYPPQNGMGDIESFVMASLNMMREYGIKKSMAKQLLMNNNHVQQHVDRIWEKKP